MKKKLFSLFKFKIIKTSRFKIIKSNLPRRHRLAYLKYKEQARVLVKIALEKYNLHYKLPYNQVRIKNCKTRWGSASKKGNLNFSYRLVYLPAHLAEYIVVHELCHLRQFNHSRNFWDLVSQTMPDYKELRKQLKKI
ncbi:MAG: hypothetical protein COU31_03400 [Candidatus Magasanikbacteria bacterium CG10_big_fil_rev_8_21_14_0_10_40_10]|uniref:YgjP-like metallopeptidase domain-containing protein n=1 Tax=Candidatus Magasanikbacteria bacterium CG10_big_fil_rev_8_21_14_0_10_40_10 TaxID=1974648 RepID=A0A2M6W3I9_9BACT|nr:MAG: hypothetical protein COU31_03400 [Candidatus Magasanikbacteria bacterium CG10_big_fil_rev_8_21_14_0_10_40_10]